VPSYVVRVWLPDRPGALGAVASRIGAVRGDLVGIDILERGGGRAIDELVVELPDRSLVALLVAEISEVDGVDVEDVRESPGPMLDPRLDALETAESLVSLSSSEALLAALAEGACKDFQADWAAVAASHTDDALASWGPVPPGSWLAAFLAGCQALEPGSHAEAGPDDVAWAAMDQSGLAVLVGRRGRPFRARERRQLAALARIVDLRLGQLSALRP
jgi:hypothetical protein